MANTFISTLYLLMMVLLPYFHLISDHHTQADTHSCSSHQHEHPQEQEQNNSHTSHDTCQLCQLLLLTIEQPVIGINVQSILTVIQAPVYPEDPPGLFIPRSTYARDPPFKTV
ncbi:MAG: hypothetical protein U9P12_01460 [Verrucomicrobiota bacterium]|nr:hypothetical protein [Verrucomicrobiota bacterium]